MVWYGSSTLPNFTKRLRNRNHRLNWKDRRHSFTLIRRKYYPSVNHRFQVPHGWDLLILRDFKKDNPSFAFYLYNATYFLNFTLFTRSSLFTYDRQTRTVEIKRFNTSEVYFSYLKSLTEILLKFHKPLFLKIKFKGKGYYVYKNARNTIAPQFGYAHRVYIYSFANSVKFLSKTKILLFGFSKNDLFVSGYELYRTRPINIFTGRGVRFARQVVYKKTGKIGAYR